MALTPGLRKHLDLLCCPGCGAGLRFEEESLICAGCSHRFGIEDDIPLLFWPNEWDSDKDDVTDIVREFYEKTPFPNYDEFDSVGSLTSKARRGLFARALDEQVPPGTRILECGCGTGQLSNFLSIANRTVFATDVCLNSLRLGRGFARDHQLERANFIQMNLFRPAFKPGSFHLVVSNGVLHHTSDPRAAFHSISRLVVPGGYVLVGLYHRYGRLITDARRVIFRLSGNRFKSLDPQLRKREAAAGRHEAWFKDQYKHPHESKHTIGEVMAWLREIDFEFVTSIPSSKPFQPFDPNHPLFEAETPGNALERLFVELGMARRGSQEGGFFVVIGRRPAGDQNSA